MKYIRTKDGIFEIDETTILTSMPPCYKVIKPTDKYYAINKKSVIKQADTILELCDGLIVEDKDNPNNWFVMEISEYQSKDNVDKKYMVDRWNFYAFIKTDKGLIYVAKMNKEGELELL